MGESYIVCKLAHGGPVLSQNGARVSGPRILEIGRSLCEGIS